VRYLLPKPGQLAGRVARYLAFMRFAFVGVTSSVLFAAVLYLAVDLWGIDARVGSVIAYLVSLPLNYILHRYVTFSHVAVIQSSIPRYFLVHLAKLLATVIVVDVVVRLMKLPLSVAIAASVTVVPAIYFLVLEGFVFRERGKPSERADA
jgi:putative flippase GtrA